MREVITNVMLIISSVAFLWHLSYIAIWEKVIINEPNKLILSLEMVLMVGFIIFAYLNIINWFKRK